MADFAFRKNLTEGLGSVEIQTEYEKQWKKLEVGLGGKAKWKKCVVLRCNNNNNKKRHKKV